MLVSRVYSVFNKYTPGAGCVFPHVYRTDGGCKHAGRFKESSQQYFYWLSCFSCFQVCFFSCHCVKIVNSKGFREPKQLNWDKVTQYLLLFFVRPLFISKYSRLFISKYSRLIFQWSAVLRVRYLPSLYSAERTSPL